MPRPCGSSPRRARAAKVSAAMPRPTSPAHWAAVRAAALATLAAAGPARCLRRQAAQATFFVRMTRRAAATARAANAGMRAPKRLAAQAVKTAPAGVTCALASRARHLRRRRACRATEDSTLQRPECARPVCAAMCLSSKRVPAVCNAVVVNAPRRPVMRALAAGAVQVLRACRTESKPAFSAVLQPMPAWRARAAPNASMGRASTSMNARSTTEAAARTPSAPTPPAAEAAHARAATAAMASPVHPSLTPVSLFGGWCVMAESATRLLAGEQAWPTIWSTKRWCSSAGLPAASTQRAPGLTQAARGLDSATRGPTAAAAK